MLASLKARLSGLVRVHRLSQRFAIMLASVIAGVMLVFLVFYIATMNIGRAYISSAGETSARKVSTVLSNQLKISEQESVDIISRMLVLQLDQTLDTVRDDVESIVNVMETACNLPRPEETCINSFFARRESKKFEYALEYVQMEDGHLYVGAPDPNHSLDYRTRPWYTNPKASGEFYISDIYTSDVESGDSVITFSLPIYRDSQFVGVAGVDANVSSMMHDLLALNSQLVMDTAMVSSDGQFIQSNMQNDDVKAVIDENSELIAQHVKDIGEGVANHSKLTDIGKLRATVVKIPKVNWAVIIAFNLENPEQKNDQIVEEIRKNTMGLIATLRNNSLVSIFVTVALMIILTIISAWIAVKFSKKMTDPIEKIVRKIRESERGNLEVDFSDIKTGDEVETIAVAIGSMLESTREYIEDVKASTAENERTSAELEIAKSIQAGMLPSVFPALPERTDLSLFATTRPARVVGGDFYDFFFIDKDHVVVLVADVSGKGVAAALFMAVAKTVIQNQASGESDPAVILTKANAILGHNNEASMFATCFLAIVNTKNGNVQYANAGHNPPLIVRRVKGATKAVTKEGSKDAPIEYVGEISSLPLGIFEDTVYESGSFKLSEKDRLVIYSDGVTEAFNASARQYDLDNFERFLNERHTEKLSLMHLGRSLMRDIDAFADGHPQSDDITILMFSLCKDRAIDHFVVTPDVGSLEDVQLFISTKLENLISSKATRDKVEPMLKLAVEEVFVNIAHYGYPEADKILNTVKIEVDHQTTKDSQTVELTFIDYGAPFDPTKLDAPQLDEAAEDRQIGGLGIFMTKQLAKSMTYERKGNKNVLKIVFDVTA